MLRGRLLARVSPQEGRTIFLFALAAYALFSLLDWLTTAQALAYGGREGNPIAASVFAQYGDIGLLVFKGVIVAFIIAVLVLMPRRVMSLRIATYLAVAFAVAVAFTDIHNVQAYAQLLHVHHGSAYSTTAPAARFV